MTLMYVLFFFALVACILLSLQRCPHTSFSVKRDQEQQKAEQSAQKELITNQQHCIDRLRKEIADVSALPFRFCVFISLLTQPLVFTFVLLLAAERVSAVIGRGPPLPFIQQRRNQQRGTDT